MQSEDDKAKASGIALATAGLILSKFSLLVAVLAGGAAVYAGENSRKVTASLHLIHWAQHSFNSLVGAIVLRMTPQRSRLIGQPRQV